MPSQAQRFALGDWQKMPIRAKGNRISSVAQNAAAGRVDLRSVELPQGDLAGGVLPHNIPDTRSSGCSTETAIPGQAQRGALIGEHATSRRIDLRSVDFPQRDLPAAGVLPWQIPGAVLKVTREELPLRTKRDGSAFVAVHAAIGSIDLGTVHFPQRDLAEEGVLNAWGLFCWA